MPVTLGSIVIDCEDPLALIPFWSAALGYERLDVFGGSYGTRASLEYLRRHAA